MWNKGSISVWIKKIALISLLVSSVWLNVIYTKAVSCKYSWELGYASSLNKI